jgi:thiamine-monophosphate kinase
VTEDTLLAKLPRRHRNLVLGIGDDCAIYRPRPSEDLVFTTDLFIEGVHTAPLRSRLGRTGVHTAPLRSRLGRTGVHTAPLRSRLGRTGAVSLGYRALARSLSDIAAMGATPRFCLVSLALPNWADARWLADFYEGLLKLAKSTDTALAGGDLSHAKQFAADVMVCGSVARGKALRRDGAGPGDAIYVSGPLGGWRHRAVPIPRLNEGRKLLGKATACIDISDGLALDLHRLCLASKVSAVLDGVPLLEGATPEQALHDGEDYELLYTAAPRTRVGGIRIGTIQRGKAGAVSMGGRRVEALGYDHFRNRT